MSPSPSQLLLAIAVFVFIVSFHKALTEDTGIDDQYAEDKRHVGVLARTGALPSLGKRYVASLARNGELPFLVRKEWHKKMHPVMSGGRNIAELLNPPAGKRYIGALARSGNLPFGTTKRNQNGETVSESEDRDVDSLLKEALDTENLWRLQLKALRQKLLEENSAYPLSGLYDTSNANDIIENNADEKRSFAALARSGNLPITEKRSVEALARAGYLPQLKPPQESEEYGQRDSSEASEELLKRSAAGLSRNGNLKGLFQEIVEGKRGGVGSLARNGYLRNGLENFADKRGGIGSLARSGTLRQKKFDEEENDELEKLISELNYLENYDDSFAGYFGQDLSASDSEKRNIGSLARARDFPFRSSAKKNYFDIDENEQKRNIASVLRSRFAQQQGKRNLGSFMRSYGSSFVPTKKEDYTELDEQYKRNIGSMAKNWLLPEHIRNSKREVGNPPLNEGKNISPAGPENNGEKKESFLGTQSDVAFHHVHKKSTHSAASDAPSYESKNSTLPENDNAEEQSRSRSKREAYYSAPPSEEYPLPVLQNSDLYDYEDLTDFLTGEGAPKKRFLGSVYRSVSHTDDYERKQFGRQLAKRHIGSLARLGWLPAFWNSHYSRSGRSSLTSAIHSSGNGGYSTISNSTMNNTQHLSQSPKEDANNYS